MKFGLFTIVAVIAIFTSSLPQGNALMEDAILEFLEELRMRMCHPIPKFGLPALDPIKIDHVETSVDNQYLVDFTGSLTNLALTGLSDFDVTSLKITTTPFRRSNMEIVMPMTVLKSLYTAKGSIARVVNLNGDGTPWIFYNSKDPHFEHQKNIVRISIFMAGQISLYGQQISITTL